MSNEQNNEVRTVENSHENSCNENKNGTKPAYVFPQWVLDWMLRPFVYAVSLLFWRISFDGQENIPASGGLIVAGNHQTYFDPFWASAKIKRPTRYLAWDAAFRWPIVGRILSPVGAWPLKVKGDQRTLRRSYQWLRDGNVIMIFPEGGRCSKSGQLGHLKHGFVRFALETGAPVLPVTINGGNRVWPRGQLLPRFSKVRVTYHPLYFVKQLPGEDEHACAERESARLAKIICSKFDPDVS
ncbi:MAG: lysophospholipid acyltransferase family protein [Pyrinomonadaceae bacterium]